ncbi:unnamed protein product [Timema podura]|uniref:Uncharacterized protein n=1 Tax=Timema podura TaxID=61482 RepID=A0ABN7P1U1_TIMPD|nr:unnamed protein product [Timema podura]
MRGMNIVLIGHTSHYLDEIAAELEQSYHIETMVIEVDFSKGSSIYDLISQAITNLDIGILVNGASVISSRPVYLIEIDQSALWEYLNVNIASVTLMTRMVLPNMLKNRRGAIVNISSLAGYFPTPLLAVYSASKTYVKHFSLALAEECRGSGVSIQTLTPSFLKSTSMSKNSFWETDNFLFPSAEVFARHAVNTLGISNHTTGYWLHGLQSWIMSCLPLWAYMRLSGITNNLLRKHYVSGSTGRLNPIHIHQE